MRRDVREFVAARFERWTWQADPNQPLDSSAAGDDGTDSNRTLRLPVSVTDGERHALRLHPAPLWIVQRGSNERTTHVGFIAGPKQSCHRVAYIQLVPEQAQVLRHDGGAATVLAALALLGLLLVAVAAGMHG